MSFKSWSQTQDAASKEKSAADSKKTAEQKEPTPAPEAEKKAE